MEARGGAPAQSLKGFQAQINSDTQMIKLQP
jgi:hypothetical protein